MKSKLYLVLAALAANTAMNINKFIMLIPLVSTCCCAFSLKTGTKVIGWLNLIAWICFSGRSLYVLYVLYGLKAPSIAGEAKFIFLISIPYMKVLAMGHIVDYVSALIISIVLLKGVYENKVQMVFSWIVLQLALLLMGLAAHLIVALAFNNFTNLFDLLFKVLDLYFVLVVYSYYKEMCKPSNPV